MEGDRTDQRSMAQKASAMRSIAVTMSMSLDGIVQAPGRQDEDTRGGFAHGGWAQRYNDEVMGREMAKGMAEPGDMLFGRRTWEDFLSVWAHSTDGNPFTTHMNAATKYVASRTIQKAVPGRTRFCCVAKPLTRWRR
jgi:dihydrofolate reductase